MVLKPRDFQASEIVGLTSASESLNRIMSSWRAGPAFLTLSGRGARAGEEKSRDSELLERVAGTRGSPIVTLCSPFVGDQRRCEARLGVWLALNFPTGPCLGDQRR